MPVKLSSDSLDWALKHIEKYGDTDIFPVPFEYEAIRYDWENNLKRMLSEIDLYNYKIRPYRRCLSPKHRFGFRVSTQLDPFDTLIYLSLLYELGNDIEAARVPVGDLVVHSYRFLPDSSGRMFNSTIGYDSFIKRSAELGYSGNYKWVVVADIADFFPRIYHHPLENALKACTSKYEHANVTYKLINKWNHSISYGIPVGQTASRLLAELTISDVDQTLLSEGVTYCRFSDDFRLFCDTKKRAYELLALLANTLFENHGLTLQQNKTKILPINEFCDAYLRTDRLVEHESLSYRFSEILRKIGIDDWYEEIEYDELASEVQEEIDKLNLKGILDEQITQGDQLDLGITRFVLRRLGQINDKSALKLVLSNIEVLYPVFKDAISYIFEIRRLGSDTRHKIGSYLIKLMQDSIVGHLEYHRSWILNIFAHDKEWDNEKQFPVLYNSSNDSFSRRELISAMGRAGHGHWFKRKKRDIGSFDPWEKRAFLAAASCLPGDEAVHWYNSIKPGLDELEKTVIKWAKDNPYG